MRAPRLLRPLGVLATLCAAACRDTATAPRRAIAPTVVAAAVAPNANNVLSAVVSVHARDADSVAVRFRLADDPTSADSVTPAVRLLGDSAVLPVLGLLPARRYVARVTAIGTGGITFGDSLAFTTGALPGDLPRFEAGGVDPSPGYVVFAAGKYGLVIDNTGRVVWYRAFATGPGLSFMAEPSGHFVVRPPGQDPAAVVPWLALDPLGNVVRAMPCGDGLQSRPHDLIEERGGGYWIMCDETRPMDLTGVGGVANARVTGTVVQHFDVAGALRFAWSAFDHFQITDVDPSERAGVAVNWTHGNALVLDGDGNLLVSFRNLDEITKIDVSNGTVRWRLGGRRNQFAFRGDAARPFAHQHGLRVYAPGGVVVLDNLGDPNQSRVERWLLDPATATATLVQSYGSTPPVVTQVGGSVQSLPDGRTLVSFGTAGHVEEIDAGGRVMWRVLGDAGYIFRAQRIRSLYAPGAGIER